MKLQKPNTAPADMTTEDLLAVVDGIRALSVDVVEYLSGVLAELRTRRISHHFFSDRILSFWQEISANQLAAEAAIGLANRPMIKAVLPLTQKDQIEITHGKEIAVARDDGATENMTIFRMDGPTLNRAFGPHGIRSIKAQSEIIRASAKVEQHGTFKVYPDKGAFRVHGEVTPEDCRATFLRLGYTIELARNANQKAG